MSADRTTSRTAYDEYLRASHATPAVGDRLVATLTGLARTAERAR